MNALLDGWQQTLGRFRDRVAIVDLAQDTRWTFGQLEVTAGERAAALRSQHVIFPAGNEVSFLVDTLAALHAGAIICPLEAGATPPGPASLEGVDAPIVLAKLTSGSTGAARIALFTPDQLAADAGNIVSTMGLEVRLPNVAAISLAHSYGFSNLVLPLLLHGIPIHLTGSPWPENLRRSLRSSGEATLPGVPAMWRAWHSAGALDARIRIAISAGAPLPLELEQGVFAATGIKIHNFLGSTECGGIAYDRTSEPRASATLAGTALDHVRLELDAEDRLLVHSAAVGTGYWPTGDETRRFGNGTFRTGDIARLEHSSVHLLGRAGDVINVAGRKVHPAEVEENLRGHSAVGECVVFGVPAEAADRGEEIAACVSFGDRAAPFEEMARWLGSRLPAWKIPRHWRAAPGLLPNERGKIPRHEWRRRFLAGDV